MKKPYTEEEDLRVVRAYQVGKAQGNITQYLEAISIELGRTRQSAYQRYHHISRNHKPYHSKLIAKLKATPKVKLKTKKSKIQNPVNIVISVGMDNLDKLLSKLGSRATIKIKVE